MQHDIERVNRSTRLILLATSIDAFITPFVSSALSFSVPSISAYYRSYFQAASLIPMVFLLSLSSFILLFGKLADVAGRTLIFEIGTIVFSISLIAGVLFRGLIFLLISLFVAGLGAGMIVSNSTSIISSFIAKERRGLALGINAMSVYLGLMLAPPVTGFLLTFYKWQSVFVLSSIIGIIDLIISLWAFNDLEAKSSGIQINFLNAYLFSFTALLLLSISVFVYILNQFILASLSIAAIIVVILFIYREMHTETPIFEGELFRGNKEFLASNMAAFLNYLSTFSIVFVFSIYLQLVLRVNPYIAGLVLLIEPVMMVIFSPISGSLSDKWGSTHIASLGLVIISLSFFLLYLSPNLSIPYVMVILAVLGIGFGLFSAPNTNSVMGSARGNRFGTASGILGTMRFSGQLLSISLAVFIMSNYMPKVLTYAIFMGGNIKLNQHEAISFVEGLRVIMFVSAVISLIGAYVSYKRR